MLGWLWRVAMQTKYLKVDILPQTDRQADRQTDRQKRRKGESCCLLVA